MNQTNRATAERRYDLARLPRMRYLRDVGVWQLKDCNGVRIWGNEMESTYLHWVEIELERDANEDYNDMPAFERLVKERDGVKTLVWSAAALLAIGIAAQAFWCVFNL